MNESKIEQMLEEDEKIKELENKLKDMIEIQHEIDYIDYHLLDEIANVKRKYKALATYLVTYNVLMAIWLIVGLFTK